MRKYALANGGGVIRICENGFSERFAPHKEEFEQMATGSLLLIALLEHNTRKEAMSYAKAQRMNHAAEKLAAACASGAPPRLREYK